MDGRTYVRTDGQTGHLRHVFRSTWRSGPNNEYHQSPLPLEVFSERDYGTFAICYRNYVCLWRWCTLLSWLKFSAFFSPYDSPGTLSFLMPKIVGGGRPFPPKICVQSDPPFQTAQFRPISAHTASTVIASEKSWISTYRKSTTRFPTSHRWTVYPLNTPKGGTKTRYRCLCQ